MKTYKFIKKTITPSCNCCPTTTYYQYQDILIDGFNLYYVYEDVCDMEGIDYPTDMNEDCWNEDEFKEYLRGFDIKVIIKD